MSIIPGMFFCGCNCVIGGGAKLYEGIVNGVPFIIRCCMKSGTGIVNGVQPIIGCCIKAGGGIIYVFRQYKASASSLVVAFEVVLFLLVQGVFDGVVIRHWIMGNWRGFHCKFLVLYFRIVIVVCCDCV